MDKKQFKIANRFLCEDNEDIDNELVAGFNRFEISMTLDQAMYCSHQGDCEQDVKTMLENPYIKSQKGEF